jgi:hypothetical protein
MLVFIVQRGQQQTKLQQSPSKQQQNPRTPSHTSHIIFRASSDNKNTVRKIRIDILFLIAPASSAPSFKKRQ